MSPPTATITKTQDKTVFYNELNLQVKSILDHTLPIQSNLANLSSLIYFALNDNDRPINWTGFYIIDSQSKKLFLGPFQGRVACTVIPVGKGVCGTSAKERATVLVENVHNFPGHIACDSASESEIVVPIIVKGELVGVLDMDSARIAEFDNADRIGLEETVKLLVECLEQTKSEPQLLLR
jgi:L-methionine (R)-S-oxide reductase